MLQKLLIKRKCWPRHAYCAFETRWNGLVLVFINSNKWFRASNCFNWISSGIVTDQISPIRLFVERGITVFYKFLKFSQFSLVAFLADLATFEAPVGSNGLGLAQETTLSSYRQSDFSKIFKNWEKLRNSDKKLRNNTGTPRSGLFFEFICLISKSSI